MKVTAQRFTETARARIEKASGECLTFDHLSMRDPLGQKSQNTAGAKGYCIYKESSSLPDEKDRRSLSFILKEHEASPILFQIATEFLPKLFTLVLANNRLYNLVEIDHLGYSLVLFSFISSGVHEPGAYSRNLQTRLGKTRAGENSTIRD